MAAFDPPGTPPSVAPTRAETNRAADVSHAQARCTSASSARPTTTATRLASVCVCVRRQDPGCRGLQAACTEQAAR
eukprot:scaffold47819_cov59-Phaeocystis_antarctica.AAC.1